MHCILTHKVLSAARLQCHVLLTRYYLFECVLYTYTYTRIFLPANSDTFSESLVKLANKSKVKNFWHRKRERKRTYWYPGLQELIQEEKAPQQAGAPHYEHLACLGVNSCKYLQGRWGLLTPTTHVINTSWKANGSRRMIESPKSGLHPPCSLSLICTV